MTGPAQPNGSAIEALASVLRGPQKAVVAADAGTGAVAVEQVGGFVLPDPFPMPTPGSSDPVAPLGDEPVIETFVVERSGNASPMGADPQVADWWRPTVETLADRVIAALAPLGVELGGPISITASATTIGHVIDEPHLDDDQYQPEAGIGVVAIAASHDGPRLATGSLAVRRAVPGAPLDLDPLVLSSWFDPDDPDDRGQLEEARETGPEGRWQSVPADRIVVFPRFGQLHAGPTLMAERAADPSTPGSRNLLVLRADTAVVHADLGSGAN